MYIFFSTMGWQRKWSGIRAIQALSRVGKAVLRKRLRSKFPRTRPEVAVGWNLKWPENVFLAAVPLKGICKHIRVHTHLRGHTHKSEGTLGFG